LTSERLTNTYAELIERQPVLSGVIEELGLTLTEEDLSSRLSVSAVRNTQLLRIVVEDPDPKMASAIANTTALVFIDDNANTLGGPGTVTVAEEARAPLRPAKPDVRLNTLLAAILGLMVVGGIAMLLEYLDDTVKASEDTETSLGLPTLGVVRKLKINKKTETALGKMDQEEAYSQLRTNVHFARLGKPLKKLVVTGSSPGDGKSTTAAGLALALAQAGESVVLVDTDLRRPSLHRIFRLRNSVGLTGLLLSNTFDPAPVLVDSGHKNLRLLLSGPLPPNPADLLMSPGMQQIVTKLCEMATYVVFDTPPVLSVTDATILAGMADGTIVVTVSGRTRRGVLKRALSDLQRTHAHVIGVVINKAKRRETGYGYEYYAAAQAASKRDLDPRLEALSRGRRLGLQHPPDAAPRSASQG
jgi:capsular exopolysaccharide synthesis family protein